MNYEMLSEISALSADEIIAYFRDNKAILDENEIKPYLVTRRLSKPKQLTIVSSLEELRTIYKREKNDNSNIDSRD